MELVHEFTCNAMLKPPVLIGTVAAGTRIYYEVIGGEITGDRVNAKVLGGGDWAIVGSDGFVHLDVRIQAETDDGAFLYIQYRGLLEFNETVQNAMANGEGTDYGDQYFYTNPVVETGDERYAWLNNTFLVGEGHALAGSGVEYRVWRPA